MTQEKIQFDGYDITATLLRGPYTVFYQGRRQKDSRDVFIKFWSTAYISSERERKRLQREIGQLKSLNGHPHVLDIYEECIGEYGVALITAAAPLGNLQTQLTNTPSQLLPQEKACTLIEQIGSALSAAHERGIVHANVNPQSIFWHQEGQVALTDFHLKSVVRTIREYQSYIEDGVPRCWYMAPEQFQGHANAYSDQYALGCLAYTLLTGRVPFAGTARSTLLQKHTNEAPVSPSCLNPDLPARIDEAILRALAKDPSQRFPSVEEFLQALRGEGKQASIILTSDLAPDHLALPTEQTQKVLALESIAGDWNASKVQVVAGGGMSGGALGDMHKTRGNERGRGKKKLIPVLALMVMLLMLTGGMLYWLQPFQPAAKQVAQVQVTRTSVATPTSFPTYEVTSTATPTKVVTPTPTPTQEPTAVPTTISTVVSTPTSPPVVIPTATPTVPIVVTQPSQNRAAIVPVVDCVQRIDGGYIAYFGYRNPNSFTVNIAQGSNNIINPEWLDGAQPGVFNPGRQYRVFRIIFWSGVVVWKLDGGSATASRQGPSC